MLPGTKGSIPVCNLLTDSNNLYPGYQARVLVHMISDISDNLPHSRHL